MKKRLFLEVGKLFILISAGFLYYIIIISTGIKLPCLFNTVTGFLCPGCGVTRMAEALIKLDFKSAYGYNKVLFLSLPILFIFFVYEEFRFIKTGKYKINKVTNVFLISEIIILLAFGIIRNII